MEMVDEATREEDAREDKRVRLARFVRLLLLAHVGLTIGVSIVTSVLAVWLGGIDGNTPAAIGLGVLASYGFVVAAMMWASARKLKRGCPDGPFWTRLSLMAAVPGTALVGLISTSLLVVYLSESRLDVVAAAMTAPISILSCLVLFALVRVLVKHDLDELVWERTEAGIEEDVALYHPDRDVVLDDAEKPEPVESSSP